jgi:uncharacterized protein YndB with AHSA1/START domain
MVSNQFIIIKNPFIMNEKITVKTSVAADIAKVWNRWTAPEHIVNWNFASDDWHCPKAENDPRTGGKFSCTMAAKDGSMSFEFSGVYDEVIPQKKISYAMGDGRRVEVEFESKDGQTEVVESFDPEQVNSIELQRNGWQSIMDNFKKYVESN